MTTAKISTDRHSIEVHNSNGGVTLKVIEARERSAEVIHVTLSAVDARLLAQMLEHGASEGLRTEEEESYIDRYTRDVKKKLYAQG